MMNGPTLTCQDERRRLRVRAEEFNGLDYLEVSDDRLMLTVYFLDKAPEGLVETNVRIKGGRRIRDIEVVDLRMCYQEDPERDDCMIVTVDKPGDFSTYTLCLVDLDEDGRPTDRPFPGFDPRYACLEFSFKAGCPSDLDCKPLEICPPPERDEPEINYLAKDYASFRQLILDRLALTMPDWQERHVPDLGIALVELLAYVGDHLSYYQDAVGTEAYLDTARQRISVRRHARLVDYQMHEGCNARAWVCVGTDTDLEMNPRDMAFITGRNETLPATDRVLIWEDLRNVPPSQYEVFAPVTEEPGPPQLRARDLKNPGCLLTKLHNPQEPVSKHLRALLSDGFKQRLDEVQADALRSPSEALQRALLEELNRLINGPSLYVEAHFADVALTRETAKLARKDLRGADLVRLNRALLEDAFPQEIARSRKPGDPIRFYATHSKIPVYTWGDQECCLPRGAIAATLQDEWLAEEEPEPKATKTYQQAIRQQGPAKDGPTTTSDGCARERKLRNLQPGDVLIFEEVIGPKTGGRADADPTRRHAVRLTRVRLDVDPLWDQPVVEIEWAEQDALPFPFCISAVGPPPDCELLHDISVARGNVILVDHGRRVEDEPLGVVPTARTEERCGDDCHPPEIVLEPARFRPPPLEERPLTFSQPHPTEAPASSVLSQDPRLALPQIWLASDPTPSGCDDPEWIARRDLLDSRAWDCHFMVEMDNERRARLRFGDGELGREPEAGMAFTATYRVGNGTAGNVGAETITHIVLRQLLSGVPLEPRNPLPAQGGINPEPIDEVKLFAPHAHRRQLQRAITADDYARLAERHPKLQRASAALRWSGSWYEVLVAVDPLGQVEADGALLDEIKGHLYRYRRIGHDLTVRPASYVPLDIEVIVCVLPGFLRGHVKAALLQVFSSRVLPDGRRGFFHPDNLTFGEGIFLSKLVAVAQAVPGVESIHVHKLERLYQGPNGEIENGVLPLGPLEVARLDNDSGFPENGRLTLDVRGGR